MDKHWLSHIELLSYLGISRATTRRWVIKGILPKPAKLGNKLYWSSSEIEARLLQQVQFNSECTR